MQTIISRAKAPTPKFFKKLRNIGLTVAAVGTTIVTAPVALPAAIVSIGGYLVVGGTVLGLASQLTTESKSKTARKKPLLNE